VPNDERPADNTLPPHRRQRTIALLAASLMIGLFLLRTLTAAHEYPSRTEQIMEIVFDLGMFVGLIALRAQVPKPLFWIALVCGLGSFAIRLTRDAACGPGISCIR
jgi:hypothetical protein